MRTKAASTSARRLTREDWIAAARKVLVASGIDDVKVDRLARRINMTRGSFYWHFQHRKDLLDALLSDWEGRNYFEISQVRVQWAQYGVDVAHVIAIWLGEDASFPAFDMAVRVWARKSKSVAEAVSRVDDAWIQLLTETYLKNGFEAEESVVRARVTYYHQVGYYAIGIQEDMADRLKRLPHYYVALTGQPAPPDLIAITLRRLEKDGPKRGRRVRADKMDVLDKLEPEPVNKGEANATVSKKGSRGAARKPAAKTSKRKVADKR